MQSKNPYLFISFKSEEKTIAEKLSSTLRKEGFNVWWSAELQCGKDWHGEIDKAIDGASAIIVLWSDKAVQSPWVRHEASQAMAKGIYAPVRTELVDIISPYDRIQATDLFKWTGETNHPGFENLLTRIRELIPKPVPLEKKIANFIWKQRGLIISSIITLTAFFLLFDQKKALDVQARKQKEIADSVAVNLKAQNKLIANTSRLLKPIPSKLTLDLSLQYPMCDAVKKFLGNITWDNIATEKTLKQFLSLSTTCGYISGSIPLSIRLYLCPANTSPNNYQENRYIAYESSFKFNEKFVEIEERGGLLTFHFQELPLKIYNRGNQDLYSIDDLDHKTFVLEVYGLADGKINDLSLDSGWGNSVAEMKVDTSVGNQHFGRLQVPKFVDTIASKL